MARERIKKTAADNVPLAQRAYDAVRDAIENGGFAPGDRVSEYRIADLLKISRTPAREGLQRLQAEGLLSYHPRRGLVVATLDDDALKELFASREVLEGALAAQAAINGSGPELAALIRHSEQEPALIGDRAAMYEHNKVFHELIRRAAHNRYLHRFSTSLDDVVAADRRGSSLVLPERQIAVVAEHRKLAEAIAARNGPAAAKASSDHIKAAFAARLQVALMDGNS
ncbi:transcriptional regulator [Terrihabitans soli]|uniref:Transcriptional regulator n=1 Tax=Terrihabitans soli TaxID=708113 RepID=A0A6S6QQD1_9HYPH|nr:GntR family transcriptional regulator [Terrihabitans soli]BCJ91249.1 transcriptional regulator [Terrihabitans soli]